MIDYRTRLVKNKGDLTFGLLYTLISVKLINLLLVYCYYFNYFVYLMGLS